jgi:hypothetical protein
MPQSGAYTIKLERESQKITTVNTDYLVGQHAVDSTKKAAARQPKAAHYHCCQQPFRNTRRNSPIESQLWKSS